LFEQEADLLDDPLVVSNMRSSFVQTRRSQEGTVRYAFSECPLESEGLLFARFFSDLWDLSLKNGWSNRFSSIGGAVRSFKRQGLPVVSLVISPMALKKICGSTLDLDEIDKIMALKGYVSEVEGLKVLVSDLSSNRSVLVTEPVLAGNCTRVGNHLGVLVRRADQTIALVEEE
jgi:hypothetical protein